MRRFADVGQPSVYVLDSSYMVAVRDEAVDSTFGRLRSDSCELYYDYGRFADPLDEYADAADYQAQQVPIGGKHAKMITATDQENNLKMPYVTAVHFAALGNGQRLTVHVRCASEVERTLAETIVRSIQFE